MRKSYLRFQALSSLLVVFAMLPLHGRAQQQSGAQSFQFINPALPVDQRVDDLIGRMTLEEKVSQMRDHAPAVPRLGIPKYDWWNEGLHGVAFAGYATNSPGHWHGCHLGHQPIEGDVINTGSAVTVSLGGAQPGETALVQTGKFTTTGNGELPK